MHFSQILHLLKKGQVDKQVDPLSVYTQEKMKFSNINGAKVKV